jgi:hypothetical protein
LAREVRERGIEIKRLGKEMNRDGRKMESMAAKDEVRDIQARVMALTGGRGLKKKEEREKVLEAELEKSREREKDLMELLSKAEGREL